MNYSSLTYKDTLQGFGVRTVLAVSGCCNNCNNCPNLFAQDPEYGHKFTEETVEEIVKSLDDDSVNGLIITGGDPLYPGNRQKILELTRTIKAIFGKDKSILMYTGYTLKDIQSWDDVDLDELMQYIDVLFEGRNEKKRCLELHFNGTEIESRQIYLEGCK